MIMIADFWHTLGIGWVLGFISFPLFIWVGYKLSGK